MELCWTGLHFLWFGEFLFSIKYGDTVCSCDCGHYNVLGSGSARIPCPRDCSSHFSLFICPLALSSGFSFVFPKVIHCSFSCSNGTLFFHPFFLYLYFVLGYSQFTNNVVIISGEQQRDSAIHIHVSILFQTPLPSSCHITLSRVPCAIQ